MKILKALFTLITKPFKWAYGTLPGFREGTTKWTQTLVFYAALGTVVFAVCKIPGIPTFAEVLVSIACALLLSFVSVVRTKVSVS